MTDGVIPIFGEDVVILATDTTKTVVESQKSICRSTRLADFLFLLTTVVLYTNLPIMSFFTKAKNSAWITKIRAEIALIDRESATAQRRFGIELYDLMESLDFHHREQKSTHMFAKVPLLLGTRTDEVKELYDTCQMEIRLVQDARDAKQQEIDSIQVNRDRALPAVTTQERLARAGEWATTGAREAQLVAEIKLLERKMNQRKEQFGLDVFTMVVVGNSVSLPPSPQQQQSAGNIFSKAKEGVASQLKKMSSHEGKIQDCIERAKTNEIQIQSRKAMKEREILRLEQETR